MSREAGQAALANVAASQTDASIVAAVAGRRIEVTGVFFNQGDTTSSQVTFNSKGAGAGTAISPLLKAPPNGGFVLPSSGDTAWFKTNVGEALTVTTGAGSATGIGVVYRVT